MTLSKAKEIWFGGGTAIDRGKFDRRSDEKQFEATTSTKRTARFRMVHPGGSLGQLPSGLGPPAAPDQPGPATHTTLITRITHTKLTSLANRTTLDHLGPPRTILDRLGQPWVTVDLANGTRTKWTNCTTLTNWTNWTTRTTRSNRVYAERPRLERT